jgi:hypothetical protein
MVTYYFSGITQSLTHAVSKQYITKSLWIPVVLETVILGNL